MKKLLLLPLLCLSLLSMGQQHDERVDPFIAVHFGLYPMALRGTGTDSGNERTLNGYYVPVDAAYGTEETKSMVLSTILQTGVDVNVLLKDNYRVGARIGGGIGRHSGVSNADGMDAFGKEVMAYGFYRYILGSVEIAGLVGYKRVWSALPYNFIMAGVEFDLLKNVGLVLSASLNRHKYYRSFTNGYEEPALKVREAGLSFFVRF